MDEITSGFLQRRRLHLLLIIFLGLLVYSNTFDAPFQFDDNVFIHYREVVSQAAEAVSGLQADKAPSEVISLPAEVYKGPWASRPLLYITFMLNATVDGFNTWGYHAVNIAFHLMNGILLYLLIVLTGRHLGHDEKTYIPVALLSSIIFVLHPIQTETVTNIVNRSMLMATTFYLMGFIFFVKITASEGREKIYYTAGLFLAAVLGAGSREDFATFPLMLVVYDLFFISRFRPREVAGHFRGYAAVLPGIALMVYFVLTHTYDRSFEFTTQELPPDAFIPPFQYALTQFKIHWTYIRLFIFPLNQNLDYDYQLSKNLADITTLIAFVGYVGLWACGLTLAKKRPAASFGILWFLITLLPISFAVALLGLRLGDPIFEHRFYLPSLGLITLAALALVHFARERRSLVPVIAVLCIALGSTAYARNYVWADDGRLWEDVVAKSPNLARPHNNLATYYAEQRDYGKAIEHFEIAIRYWPSNAIFYANLGNVYLGGKDVDRAIEHLKTAVELAPNLPYARELLGDAYMEEEQYDEALDQFIAISKLAPWDTAPLNAAARACYALGNKEEAIKHYISSLWIDRKQVKVLHNISVLYMETGQPERAIEHLEALVSFAPGHVPARLALGRLYMEKNQPLKAVYHLREALKFNPDSPNVHRALAGVYEKVGNVRSADEHLKRANTLEKALVSNASSIW